jgi:hypothetical protein
VVHVHRKRPSSDLDIPTYIDLDDLPYTCVATRHVGVVLHVRFGVEGGDELRIALAPEFVEHFADSGSETRRFG